ncbi:MAG: hypothetical protein KDD02_19740 [Phaeodactylibacter sp.]|nr:hypothetical protein [Phaeodactylibacter sp.]MCB9303222.1 hypothetical protein [Lewinellaceae bacterium]
MIQRKTTLIALLIMAAFGLAIAQTGYTYQADLSSMQGNRLTVKLTVPEASQAVVNFVFPSAVPGYYHNDLQFGRLVYNVQAFGPQRQSLPVEQLSFNRWRIKNAKLLRYIEYEVEDAWNHKGYSKWLPAENIFVRDKAYLLNPAALFGYLEGKENLPFYVYLTRPAGLFASSGLNIQADARRDAFSASSYQELAGRPILYTDQEPVSFKVGNTTMEIAVFSEKGAVRPQQIRQVFEPMFSALASYLGGALPIDQYAFLFFFYSGEASPLVALEHRNSSVWVWPEQWDPKLLKAPTLEAALKNAGFHEFLHCYAPLNIHSEEFQQFDFDNPSMSSHLWLYEGTTEYLNYHAQVNQRLISEEVFNWFVNDMLAGMKEYRQDVSLTDISSRVYGELADRYDNVAYKGFLVNLLLDIKLRQLSGGKSGLKHLIQELSARYGNNKAFKDSELFDIIAGMTYPQIGAFLKAHVGVTEPLPLEEIFGLVGYEYDPVRNKVKPKDEAPERALQLREKWLFGE